MDTLLGVAAALACLGVAFAAWRLGDRLARRLGRRAGEAAAAAALLLTAALILLVNHLPDRIPVAVVVSPLIDLEFTYFVPTALLFFGLAARRAPDPRTRRPLALFAALVAVYGAGHLVLVFHARTLPALDDRPPPGRVARQNTRWSCGAAACATLLKARGVVASEREMGELCRTLPFRGTTLPRFVRGLTLRLRREGSPLAVRAAGGLTVSDIDTFPVPCILAFRLNPVLHHAVVLLGREPGGLYRIGDPIGGVEVLFAREDLERMFAGEAIAIVGP